MEINKNNKIYSKVETPFGWRRNLDYIKEKVVLAGKQNKEYKANLWSILTADIIFFFVYMMFYSVFLGSVVNNLVGWNSIDFVTFYMLIIVATKFIWFFSLTFFSQELLKGRLNIYLTKPIHSFYFSNMERISGATVVTIPLSILILILVIIFNDYQNIFISLLLLILSTIYYILFINFIESLAFFIKQNSFISHIFFQTVFINEKFTPKVFDGSLIKNFMYLLPSAFFGYMILEVLKGNFLPILEYWFYFIWIGLLLILGTYFLWYYGLKKYEAFG